MVNQRILPPTFPRYTKIKDRALSINFLEEMVQRIKQACKIIHCTNYHSALVNHYPTLSNNKFRLTDFSAFFYRTFLWILVKNRGHACYRAAFCSHCIFHSQI